jgi:lipid-A-disaccharide synthase
MDVRRDDLRFAPSFRRRAYEGCLPRKDLVDDTDSFLGSRADRITRVGLLDGIELDAIPHRDLNSRSLEQSTAKIALVELVSLRLWSYRARLPEQPDNVSDHRVGYLASAWRRAGGYAIVVSLLLSKAAKEKAKRLGVQVLLSCGEASGELYAAGLVRELRALDPEIESFGLGGDRLRDAGAEILVDLKEISVIGLVEVVGKLPALKRAQTTLVEAAAERRPDVAILIDFSGFNLRLSNRLKSLGIPIVYYVSPQVWAWRRGRLKTIKKNVDKMLVILPFEEAFYREAGIAATFVGHPLVDIVRSQEDRSTFLRRIGLDANRPVIVLMPGSRAREIELHLPVLAGAIQKMKGRRPDLQFVLLKAPTVDLAAVAAGLSDASSSVHILSEATYEGLSHADVAIVASGTATVEAALCETPMVVVYRVGGLSYFLGKPLVQVPHYAMVNLIAERSLVPELIQEDMTVERVCSETLNLLESAEATESMRRGLREVSARLGAGGASRKAAEEVLSVAQQSHRARRPHHEVLTT